MYYFKICEGESESQKALSPIQSACDKDRCVTSIRGKKNNFVIMELNCF